MSATKERGSKRAYWNRLIAGAGRRGRIQDDTL